MSEIFYKYRSFRNFEHLVDILVNSRIYTANYAAMNDPMEGCYKYPDSYDKQEIAKLEKKIIQTKFCSLSKFSNIDLMWAHYANGNRGICIGVEIKKNSNFDELLEVNYNGQLNIAEELKPNNSQPKEILRHKNLCWEYEAEVRVFPKEGRLIDVNVKELIFGKRVDRQLAPLVKELMSKFQPKAKISNQI